MITLKELQDELKPIKADVHMVKEGMYNPDTGLFARVNLNTSWRKIHQKIYWLLLGALIIAAIQQGMRFL